MSTSGVAVVISCYELGRTLEEAVDSARCQTRPPAEIVVVDDGSRDPYTRGALARLVRQRVKVVRIGHGGPAQARNIGLESSTAPLVVFLDADDLFESTYLERATEALAERPDLGFVCCALQAFGRASYRWKPPPYSIAEAVGRGACGHISTVFRREIWQAVGGFDPALPAYEDVDFWLRALELGFRGLILDAALLRYRVRRGSRYHSAVVQGHYLPAKELLIDKHFDAIESQGEEVFVAALDFQRELSGHSRSLAAEQRQLREETAGLENSVAESRAALEELGAAPFAWGELYERAADPGQQASITIEGYYLERFLGEVDAVGRRRLTIRPGDPWPEKGKPRFDVILVAGALELEDDPRAALLRCRNALRSGGLLATAAPSTTLSRKRGLGFTEASLRALLSELFPPESVEVVTYGNLLTCLASAAGLPASALDEIELGYVDPCNPTLVAASARRPGSKRRRRPDRRDGLEAARLNRSDRGVILLYHRIASLEPDTHRLCTPPDVFQNQMTFVAERCTPLSLQDLASRAVERRLPAGAVAVTFDDGYLDNLTVASPILTRLGIPATFFVNGHRAEEEREAEWDTLERIFAGDESLPDRLRVEIDAAVLDMPTGSTDERQAALSAVHALLLSGDGARRRLLVDELVGWSSLKLPVRPTHRLMTSREVARLSELPSLEIGAHGADHLLLTAHGDDVIRRELEDNRSLLEGVVGTPVRTLAYPYGACDFRTTRIAEQLGFAVACSVDPDPVTSDCDPLRLPRFEVGPGVDGFEFRVEQWLSAT